MHTFLNRANAVVSRAARTTLDLRAAAAAAAALAHPRGFCGLKRVRVLGWRHVGKGLPRPAAEARCRVPPCSTGKKGGGVSAVGFLRCGGVLPLWPVPGKRLTRAFIPPVCARCAMPCCAMPWCRRPRQFAYAFSCVATVTLLCFLSTAWRVRGRDLLPCAAHHGARSRRPWRRASGSAVPRRAPETFTPRRGAVCEFVVKVGPRVPCVCLRLQGRGRPRGVAHMPRCRRRVLTHLLLYSTGRRAAVQHQGHERQGDELAAVPPPRAVPPQ